MKTLEQICRELLEIAIHDGLVLPNTNRPKPQQFSFKDLIRMLNYLSNELAITIPIPGTLETPPMILRGPVVDELPFHADIGNLKTWRGVLWIYAGCGKWVENSGDKTHQVTAPEQPTDTADE